ncbi:hypothetical protein [Nonomuraea gerenzanensis]|uniref:Uncharacterized protein n=1 Tax=Nonomuraea gerenzanensis TaxID=93944 RepID=A0A1M4EDS3_9ACTN|nr:hypothetical protein [Nonomuraea gerenzanensis]UBU08703.1 hypothetical protein LCN96_30430 [Nonomuraea gerenzanensis]SBO97065.1 hypothetical protein BN4615_P6581 [Nonomuraea gerenzanensis]
MMSAAVVSASVLQLLLAATFFLIPVVGRGRGPAAQAAAGAEVARQGLAAGLLARHRIDFGASRASVVVAMSIGGCLVVLAVLNLAGSDTGRVLTWIFQGIVFVLGCVIMPGEVFTTRYLEAAARRSGDPELRALDVAALVGAAAREYPGWFRAVVAARFALATLGSLAVIALLVLPTD